MVTWIRTRKSNASLYVFLGTFLRLFANEHSPMNAPSMERLFGYCVLPSLRRSMNTVKIYQLNNLSPTQFARLKTSQQEAAQVWNFCMEMHKQARMTHAKWPGRNELQKATKGHFALHSQSVQMIVHAFLANVETTRQLKPSNQKMKYPWKTKRFY